MSERSLCIKVKKNHGEKALISANKLGIINREFKIHQNTNHIYVPLIRQPEENELSAIKAQLPDFELTTIIFTKKKKQRKTIAQVLENRLPPHLLASLPRALDIIGDIAIIEIPPELSEAADESPGPS